MQIHLIAPKTKRKKTKRVGRGGKRGTYSGRGLKGQKARAGRKIRPEVRDMIKKVPKKRGYRFSPVGEKPVVINLRLLGKAFERGADVNPAALVEKGLIAREGGRVPAIKILGDGDIAHAVTVSGCAVSESARAKIEKAGGAVVSGRGRNTRVA